MYRWGFLLCAAPMLAILLARRADARILVVGDSNAAGVGVATAAAWPMRLAILLDEPVQLYGGPGASLGGPFPLGIGVNTFPTPGAAAALTPPSGTVVGDGPSGVKVNQGIDGFRYAILALGTNDGKYDSTVTQIRNAVAAILGAATCRWVCLIPSGHSARASEVRNAIKQECQARGAGIMDGNVLLARPQFFQKDHLHLSSLGHQVLTRAIADLISPLPK